MKEENGKPQWLDDRDLLCGAEEIADFLFNDRTQAQFVRELAKANAFPHFMHGSEIYARKSDLLGRSGAIKLSDDLLIGAGEIALYMYKTDDQKHRRKIHHLNQTSKIPFFKIGGRTCARKSTLDQWIKDQENKRK